MKQKLAAESRLGAFARLKPRTRDNIAGYSFMTLHLIGILFFTAYPFCMSLYYAFTDYNIFKAWDWVGIHNFVRMFTIDRDFWQALKVTFKYAIVDIPLHMCCSLAAAVLLSRKSKLEYLYRVIFYIPSLVGGTVGVSLVWKQIFNYNGVINGVLAVFGIQGPNWFRDPDFTMWILWAQSFWIFGSSMLIYIAAIKDVPASLKEAAKLDGAGSVQVFFKVILPMITPSMFYTLITGLIGAMQTFNGAFLITGEGPLKSTLFYAFHQYRYAFEHRQMGYASGLAWFLMVIIIIWTAITFKSSGTWVYYENEV